MDFTVKGGVRIPKCLYGPVSDFDELSVMEITDRKTTK